MTRYTLANCFGFDIKPQMYISSSPLTNLQYFHLNQTIIQSHYSRFSTLKVLSCRRVQKLEQRTEVTWWPKELEPIKSILMWKLFSCFSIRTTTFLPLMYIVRRQRQKRESFIVYIYRIASHTVTCSSSK